MAIYQSKKGTADHYLRQIESQFMETAINGNLVNNYDILASIMEDCAKQLRKQAETLTINDNGLTAENKGSK